MVLRPLIFYGLPFSSDFKFSRHLILDDGMLSHQLIECFARLLERGKICLNLPSRWDEVTHGLPVARDSHGRT